MKLIKFCFMKYDDNEWKPVVIDNSFGDYTVCFYNGLTSVFNSYQSILKFKNKYDTKNELKIAKISLRLSNE